MASLGKDAGRDGEVRRRPAALKSRVSFKLDLCLLHQTVLNINCDHVGWGEALGGDPLYS